CANSRLDNRQVDAFCKLDREQIRLLEDAIERLGLSARAYHRILKVARTIADLADSDRIETAHVAEAISYRQLDRPLV
ncbi:MAG: ATP-binding protein, partial [Pseudomonadota bacterium]